MRALTLFILTLVCVFTFNLLHADTTTDNDDGIGDDSAKDDTQVYFLYDGIDLATTLKFQYPKAKMMIKTVYPVLHSEDENEAAISNFNALVLEIINQEIDEFKNQVAQMKPDQAKLAKSVLKNDLYIDYDSSFINMTDQHVLSVRFTIAGMIAGSAHGYHTHRVLNYDLDAGEPLGLEDLFLPDADFITRLSEYTRGVLTKRLSNKEMVIAGTEPTPANFREWNVKPIGLVITFDEYQVAPYVFGAQTVLIPYSALNDILDPDSPIYSCIKSHSRCMRNNLLTGGFIDEALNTRHRRFNPLLS